MGFLGLGCTDFELGHILYGNFLRVQFFDIAVDRFSLGVFFEETLIVREPQREIAEDLSGFFQVLEFSFIFLFV